MPKSKVSFKINIILFWQIDKHNILISYLGKQGDDMEIVALNYTNSDFRMLFILPEKYVKNISLEDLDFETLDSKLTSTELSLKLPKFKIEFEAELVKTFESLGVKEIFRAANFQEMIDREDVRVDSILHKAVVEVQEEGAEAAAATAFKVSLFNGASFVKPKVIEFDRPFLFIIQDVNHKIPLFMGRIFDPRYYVQKSTL